MHPTKALIQLLRISDQQSQPHRSAGSELMNKLIEAISHGVPSVLTEADSLGRTLKRLAPDFLACFVRPGTSNGPTEAINGRLEYVGGVFALGFRNLVGYIA